MKIELVENKVYFNNGSEKKEIHPFWLRERVNGEEYLDKGTQQRLFDPTFLNNDVSINKVNLRSLIDKDTEEEMNTPLAKFFDKVYYFITLVPFVLPIIYYNTNLISFNFL